jgi:tRNA threonylcarbamoyladenosine biosynthesis protein TsaE
MNISAKLRAGVTTESADETRALAAEFALTLPPDTTIALHGDLGVGKTTFVQGLAQGLGVHAHVTSPTFAIYSVYRGKGRTLVHLDAFRIERPEQAEDLMLDEFLVSPWVLAAEWPEKLGTWLPAGAMHVELSIVDGDRHRVRLR